jgi:UDP-GlcNAc:undecaprenyl-phosphate GlcNAc-1-phosphate transferase
MILACLSLLAIAFLISCPMTAVMRRLGSRLGQMDQPGERKIHTQPIPATGGVAIFVAIAAPMAAGLLTAWLVPDSAWASLYSHATDFLPGVREVSPLAATLVLALLALHVTGLVDDRKALGPYSKLLIQLAVAAVLVIGFKVRVLELLGPVASSAVTILWLVAITNAFNFLDNMDGLSGGVGAICGALFMSAALVNQQWFVAGCLALLVGALIGFLIFNFPPATIFMGDAGSLVVGFVLAFFSVRITYFNPADHLHWWGVFTPLLVLAIPLYDLLTVTLIRLAQGKSPLKGDTQHFSHRLVRRGLSRRAAVGIIWACTLATGLGGIMLARVEAWQAALVVAQTAAVLLVLAVLERTPYHREI